MDWRRLFIRILRRRLDGEEVEGLPSLANGSTLEPNCKHLFWFRHRYADVLVHRLLAACIGADDTYPALLNKQKVSEVCKNLNYRNRMAQYAGRASVALHTHVSIALISAP